MPTSHYSIHKVAVFICQNYFIPIFATLTKVPFGDVEKNNLNDPFDPTCGVKWVVDFYFN